MYILMCTINLGILVYALSASTKWHNAMKERVHTNKNVSKTATSAQF